MAFTRFIDQECIGGNCLSLSAGRVARDEFGRFIIAYEQMGMQSTFSIGQPVYDAKNNLMGYMAIGLCDNLNYCGLHNGERIPSERWEIRNPTKYCIPGTPVITYWQRWKVGEKEAPTNARA